ncbi:MAG: NUDIX hydrolase [Patescibacteria group bacterium]
MRHTNIPAVFLVYLRKNKILLARRQNTGYHDGDYSLVSGHVEAGESFTKAMIREAEEEAGLILFSEEIHVVHVQHRKSAWDGSERTDVYFLLKDSAKDPCNLEPKKCSELAWFGVNNLPDNVIGGVKRAIGSILKEQWYSEYGW